MMWLCNTWISVVVIGCSLLCHASSQTIGECADEGLQCQMSCVDAPDEDPPFACECDVGYELDDDGLSCGVSHDDVTDACLTGYISSCFAEAFIDAGFTADDVPAMDTDSVLNENQGLFLFPELFADLDYDDYCSTYFPSLDTDYLTNCITPMATACVGNYMYTEIFQNLNANWTLHNLNSYIADPCDEGCDNLQTRHNNFIACVEDGKDISQADEPYTYCSSSQAFVDCMWEEVEGCWLLESIAYAVTFNLQYIPGKNGLSGAWTDCDITPYYIIPAAIYVEDFCYSSPCSPYATCTNSPSGAFCECFNQYTGDGMTCTSQTFDDDFQYDCMETIQSDYEYFSSHAEYNVEDYENDLDCLWELSVESTGYLRLVIYHFDLEEKSEGHCVFDYVEMYENDVILERYCGDVAPEPFVAESGAMKLLFHTDSSVRKPGFGAYIELTEVNTPAPDSFDCGNGVYIRNELKCDGVADCANQSDEDPTAAGCEELYQCVDGTQIELDLVCNGVRDCPDASDEASCRNAGLFLCDSLTDPISIDFLCDGESDCENGHDESLRANCTLHPCEGDVCHNGGSCAEVVNGYFVEYNCTCTDEWDGEQCQKDISDECEDSDLNCLNGGVCFDGVGRVFCQCPRGYAGRRCDEDTGISDSFTMRVSNRTGIDSQTCGTNEDPCKSLSYAIARAPVGGDIALARPPTETRKKRSARSRARRDVGASDDLLGTEYDVNWDSTDINNLPDQLWISRAISIVAMDVDGSMPIIDSDVIIAGTRDRPITVTFEDLAFRGTMYAVNAHIEFENCVFKDFQLRQATQRREVGEELELKFHDCAFYNSTLTTIPKLEQEGATPLLYVEFKSFDTLFEQSLVNLTAVKNTLHIENNIFRGLSGHSMNTLTRTPDPSETAIGVYVYSGVYYTMTVVTGDDTDDDAAEDSKDGTTSTVQTEVDIIDSTFTSMFQNFVADQAALSLISNQKFKLSLKNCLFEFNNRAVNIYLIAAAVSDVFIDNCEFNGNMAGGPGGAVFTDQTLGTITTSMWDCTFTNNLAIEIETVFNNSQTTVGLAKVMGSGGAVAVNMDPHNSAHYTTISSSIFRNNTADTYGGTIYMSPSAYGRFHHNHYQNTDDYGVIRPRVGDIIESRGDLWLQHEVLDVQSADGSVPIISYRASKLGEYILNDNVTVICPIGYDSHKVASSIKLESGRDSIETLLIYCEPCTEELYSLFPSQISMTDLTFTETDNQCKKCPYGAECDTDVRAKANFWGDVYNNEITMYLCPDDYCCQNVTCSTFDMCAANRTGILCGECYEGHSEALFSADCIRDEECTYASLFWLIIVLYGLFYVLFFVLEEEWQMILSNFTIWIKGIFYNIMLKCCGGKCSNLERSSGATRNNNQADDEEDEEEEDDTAGAYMSIFMYYIQIPSLLKISILYLDHNNKPLDELLSTLKNIFSFNTVGIHLKTCLFKGVTAVFKVWIKSAFVVYLFLVLILVYVVVKPISNAIGRQDSWSFFRKSAPVNAKFISALVSLLLYTYQYFAENGFAMLKCITIESESSLVLFIDAHVHCYTSWQYFVIAFVLIYVIPFAGVLALGPDLLKRKVINVVFFIVSLFLPLFSTPYLIYKFVHERRRDNADQTGTRGDYRVPFHSKDPKDKTAGDLVSRLLADPYRNSFGWGICWEGIIALRRLVLIVIATFVPSLLFRHILLVLGCLIAVILQLVIKPFAKASCNFAECCSLVIILGIAIMNLLKAAYFQSGDLPDETADDVFHAYDWIEALLLGIIPLCIVGLVVCGILARSIAWIAQRCHLGINNSQRRTYEHSGNNHLPHLQPTRTNTGYPNEAFNYYDHQQERLQRHRYDDPHEKHERKHKKHKQRKHKREAHENGFDNSRRRHEKQYDDRAHTHMSYPADDIHDHHVPSAYDQYIDSKHNHHGYQNNFKSPAPQYHPNYHQHPHPSGYPDGSKFW